MGRRIVFRSERDGGGLYITETLGGTERKLVPERPVAQFLAGRHHDRLPGRGPPASRPSQQDFLVPREVGSPGRSSRHSEPPSAAASRLP